MPKPQIARFKKPQSLAQLTRGRGWNSELTGFLLPMAVQDYYYRDDRFDGTVLDQTNGFWIATADSGSTAFAINALEGGGVAGVTEASANDAIQLKGRVLFAAARNPGVEFKWKASAVTSYKTETGFNDPLSDDTLGVVAAGAQTTANGATDFVILNRDTSYSTTTPQLLSDGTTSTSIAATDFLTTAIPVVATYTTYLVQAGADYGYGVIDNDPTNASASLTTGPDDAVLMEPVFFFQTIAATATTVDIQRARVWMEYA